MAWPNTPQQGSSPYQLGSTSWSDPVQQSGYSGMQGMTPNSPSFGGYNSPFGATPGSPTAPNMPSMMQNFSQGVGAFTSLAQIYGMFQSLGLQKKAFKFAQEGTKRNFNAQATAYNDAVASKETARRASTADRGQDYNSLYAYGTGEKVAKWT